MKRGERWLSEGAEALALACERGRPPTFDVVVVGSGYGGAVAAARLSALASAPGRAPMSVCVLERGLEYTPGDFPDRFSDLVGHLRVDAGLPGAPANPEALMDWRLGGDVAALVANGLGGGSLINAGVCEPASLEARSREAWPAPWRGNEPLWRTLYQRASQRLGAQAWPAGGTDKQAAMAELAGRLGATSRPVAVTIAPPLRPAQALDAAAGAAIGPQQPTRPCIECGDCFSGCNVGAKRTLSHNYLADAARQGARLFTGATVHSVVAIPPGTDTGAAAGSPPRWIVRWRLTDPARLPGGMQFFEVRAHQVVLAAGTYGSTEILMRSRDAGLAVSGRLGDGFSANGDLLSAWYDLGRPVGISPDENLPLAARAAGPTISSQIEWETPQPEPALPRVRHVVQDLSVPGALGWVFNEVVTTMMVPQRWTRPLLATQRSGDPDPYAVDRRAISRTLLTVAYADDGAGGRLEPAAGWATAARDGALVVRWKNPGKTPAIESLDQRLADSTPGVPYLRNPLWQFMPRAQYLGLGQADRRLLTVHPLGGCRMAETAHDGVVDPWGGVFNTGLGVADDGQARSEAHRNQLAGGHARTVHAGLYVLDGAIVPAALGINPLLTITALAEGAIDHWAAQLGWAAAPPENRELPPLALPLPAAADRAPATPTAVQFEERMHGVLPDRPGQDRQLDYRLSMKVRFQEIPDLQAFLAQPLKQLPLTAVFAVEAEVRPPHQAPGRDRGQPVSTPQALTLSGRVRWFDVEPSCVGQRFVRAAVTYLRTRLLADHAESRHRQRPLLENLGEKLRGLTHFGAIRQLAYDFDPLPTPWVLVPPQGDDPGLTLPANTRLSGRKRVGYHLPDWRDPSSANPWRQLTELPLVATLPGQRHALPLGTLDFDPMAMIDRYDLPLKITRQANAVAAMRDVTSLGLYFGRVMFGLHMFSFRRAEYPAEINGPRGLRRLPPASYQGHAVYADIELTTWPVAQQPLGALPGDPPLRLQLTRLRRPGGSAAAAPDAAAGAVPVLLIHGFGSGGVQFTHPDIPDPMAAWLARQGHDVWVAELRTSIGLPSHRLQWSMDEVALHDIPLLAREVCRLTGLERPAAQQHQPQQLSVVAHCIGSAMFSMALLAGRMVDPQGRPLVHSAVLMQVGPHVQLPRTSRARAYAASRLRQLVGAAEAHSVAGQQVGDAESFLDRLIGSYLYPEDQRSAYALGCDVHRNAARTNANRSAAIFGQLFQRENMNDGLMRALDELLGSCNLSTYEQTAQYAFDHRLTNQAGEDVYVTDAALRAHFDLPLLLVHGDENQTFHRDTLQRNVDLLTTFNARVASHLVRGFGHLDCVVGVGAATKVFGKIDAHLRGRSDYLPPHPGPAGADLRLPRVGPWLGHAQVEGDQVLLRLGLRLDRLGNGLQGVASLLCDDRQALAGLEQHAEPVPATPPLPLRHERVIEVRLPVALADHPGALRLLVAAAHHGWPVSAPRFMADAATRLQRLQDLAHRLGTPLQALDGLQIDPHWLRRLVSPAPQDLGLVLGACRQRPLLVDRAMADRSLAAIDALLDADAKGEGAAGTAPVDAVILCGDQVYADSRVDAGNIGATEGRFLDAHHEAWSAPGQRRVLRRRPVYMVVDDHEFRNDYNDEIARSRPREFGFARRAWQAYQQAAGPTAPPLAPGNGPPGVAAWRSFALRGFPVFLCDTRSDRLDPPRVDRDQAHIMGAPQMQALCDWLLAQQGEQGCGARPKIVVTGTPIAPWFREADDRQAPGRRLWSDGWQRYPASVATLLGWIARHEIDNVLFLSGDYHRHADARLWLQAPGQRKVQARSIVTGGLYSPFPFANATVDEWLTGNAAAQLPAGDTQWGYELQASSPGSGYTRLTLRADGTVESQFTAV